MRNHMAAGWFYSPSQILRYIPSRVTSLAPPKAKLRSPIAVLGELTRHQWLMFLVGFLGWTWDAFDFFTVSLCVTEISKEFNASTSAVSWGITVTLMLRSVGAFIFGIFADRYGRKWPMIINLFFFIVLELGSGFCQTLEQFIAIRALYGIAMGGLFGAAAATALEDLPYEARGMLSGLYEMGYSFGYLLASAFYRALVPTTTHGWRSLFWFGSGPPILIIIFRWMLPETSHFQVMKAEREARAKALGADGKAAVGLRAWFKDSGNAMKQDWFLFIFLVVLMTGLNSVSHGSQDLYPTFLVDQANMDPTQQTIVLVVGQIGAVLGGTFFGYISTFFGRRLTMMTSCVMGAALVPAYTFPRNMSLVAAAFFEQFAVMGVWGPIPVFLLELSPPSLSSFMVGFTYQLGNLASSASATIEATIASRFPLPDAADGTKRYDYGKVIAIFLGSVWAYIFFFLFWSPEMTQAERDEMAEEALRLENLRKQGASLAELGEQKYLGAGKKVEADLEEDAQVEEEKHKSV